MNKIKNLPVFIDIIFCAVILPTLIALLPLERWMTRSQAFVYMLIAWLYIVYVTNRYYIMPNIFGRKKAYWKMALLFLATTAGTYMLTLYQMDMQPGRLQRMRMLTNANATIRLPQQAVWLMYMVAATFSTAVGLLTELYRQMNKRQQAEFEKKKAELALYKAQINPHFLFNNLNTLYGMVVTQSPQTEDAFIQFINLLKYMYSNNTKDKIPLKTEVEYIQQYIELQKYRMPDNFHVHFSYVHDATEETEIAPMILITFIENVFKHGISSYRQGDADIIINAEKGKLMMSTCNPLLNRARKKQSDGIGIENCRKRLKLMYPEKHSLSIEENEGMYKVTLIINL